MIGRRFLCAGSANRHYLYKRGSFHTSYHFGYWTGSGGKAQGTELPDRVAFTINGRSSYGSNVNLMLWDKISPLPTVNLSKYTSLNVIYDITQYQYGLQFWWKIGDAMASMPVKQRIWASAAGVGQLTLDVSEMTGSQFLQWTLNVGDSGATAGDRMVDLFEIWLE